MKALRIMGALAIAASMVTAGGANAQTKCKPPTVLHNGSCVHPDDISKPDPTPKPTPTPTPRPVVRPQPPPPDPIPEPDPEPIPDPEPEFVPDPVPEPDPLPDPAPDDGDGGTSGQTIGGYVLIGVGAASLVVGAITGGLVLSKKSAVEEHCDENLACDQEGVDAADAGKTFSGVSTATFIIGAAAVAAGILLIVLDDSDEGQVALTVGPGSLGVSGSF